MTTRLTFTPGNHSYWLADPDTGKKTRVPSVSSLVKTLHTFDAERWVIGETAEAVAADWDRLTDTAPPLRAEEIRALAARAVAKPREFGTAVHHYAEALWTGQPVEVPPDYAGHVLGIAAWFTDNQVTVRHAEALVWAEAGDFGESAMAGRCDLIIDHPRHGLGILDLKSWQAGRAGQPKHAQWAMQLAAYSQMEWIVIDDTDQPMPVIEWCGVLHVGPATTALHLLRQPDWHRANDQVDAARTLKNLTKPKMEEQTA